MSSTRREQTRSGLAVLLGPSTETGRSPTKPVAPVDKKQVNAIEMAPPMPSHGAADLPLSSIDADPDQPRKSFDETALRELADSIQEYGLLQAITVRPNPKQPGRYIIKTGERRYRASKLAGLRSIPAVIDSAAMHAHRLREIQMIENIHREELTPMEIAAYLREKLVDGKKKGEIAALIKKSPSFVSRHLALINLPKILQEAFDTGRCSDVSVIYELRMLYKDAPEKTEEWLAQGNSELTRSSVGALRQFIREGQGEAHAENERPISPGKANEAPKLDPAEGRRPAKQIDAERSESLSQLLGTRVQVETTQIRIMYLNPEELARIEQILKDGAGNTPEA